MGHTDLRRFIKVSAHPKMRQSTVLEERASSAGEDNQNGGGGTARVKPEIDLSSPLFSASQYLAVTHGVRASLNDFLYGGIAFLTHCVCTMI